MLNYHPIILKNINQNYSKKQKINLKLNIFYFIPRADPIEVLNILPKEIILL